MAGRGGTCARRMGGLLTQTLSLPELLQRLMPPHRGGIELPQRRASLQIDTALARGESQLLGL